MNSQLSQMITRSRASNAEEESLFNEPQPVTSSPLPDNQRTMIPVTHSSIRLDNLLPTMEDDLLVLAKAGQRSTINILKETPLRSTQFPTFEGGTQSSPSALHPMTPLSISHSVDYAAVYSSPLSIGEENPVASFPIRPYSPLQQEYDLPYSILPVTNIQEGQFNLINVYYSAMVGLGAVMLRKQRLLRCFPCIDSILLEETMQDMLEISGPNLLPPLHNWQSVTSMLFNEQYHVTIAEWLKLLRTSTIDNQRSRILCIQHCKWKEARNTGNNLLSLLSAKDSCEQYVLAFSSHIDEAMAYTRVSDTILSFLYKSLQTQLTIANFGVPNCSVSAATRINISTGSTDSKVMFVATQYREFKQWVHEHGSILLSDVSDRDIISINDVAAAYTFHNIVLSVYGSVVPTRYQEFSDSMMQLISQYQTSNDSKNVLIPDIRKCILLLGWMCQQITVVSLTPNKDIPLYAVIKTHNYYYPYDLFLVALISIMDDVAMGSTVPIIVNDSARSVTIAHVPSISLVVKESNRSSWNDHNANIPQVQVNEVLIDMTEDTVSEVVLPTVSRSLPILPFSALTVPVKRIIKPTLLTSAFTPTIQQLTPLGGMIPVFLLPFVATLDISNEAHFVWSMVDHMLQQQLIINNQVIGLPKYLFHPIMVQAFERYARSRRDGELSVPRMYMALQNNFLGSIVEVKDCGLSKSDSRASPVLFPQGKNPNNTLMSNASNGISNHEDECAAALDIEAKAQDESCQNFSQPNHNSSVMIGKSLFLKPGASIPLHTVLLYTGEKVTITSSTMMDQLLDGPKGDKILELTENIYVKGDDLYLQYANMDIIDPTKNLLRFMDSECGMVTNRRTINGGSHGLPITVEYADDMKGFAFYNKFFIKQLSIVSNILQRMYPAIEAYLTKHVSRYEQYTFQSLFTTVSDEIESIAKSGPAIQRSYLASIMAQQDNCTSLDRIRIMYVSLLDGEFMTQLQLHYPTIALAVQKKQTICIKNIPCEHIPWYLFVLNHKDAKFSLVHEQVTNIDEHPFRRHEPITIFLMTTEIKGTGELDMDPVKREERIRSYQNDSVSEISSNNRSRNSRSSNSLPLVQQVKDVKMFSDDSDNEEEVISKVSVLSILSPPSSPARIIPSSLQSPARIGSSLPIRSIHSKLFDEDSLPSNYAEFRQWDGKMGPIPSTGPLVSGKSTIMQASNPYVQLIKSLNQSLPECSETTMGNIIKHSGSLQGQKYLVTESNPFHHSTNNPRKVDLYTTDHYSTMASYLRYLFNICASRTHVQNLVYALHEGTLLVSKDREVINQVKRVHNVSGNMSNAWTITSVFGQQVPDLVNIRLLKPMLVHLLIWYITHFDGIRTPALIYQDIQQLTISGIDDFIVVLDQLIFYHRNLGSNVTTITQIMDTIQNLLRSKGSMDAIMQNNIIKELYNLVDMATSEYDNLILIYQQEPVELLVQAQVSWFRDICVQVVDNLRRIIPYSKSSSIPVGKKFMLRPNNVNTIQEENSQSQHLYPLPVTEDLYDQFLLLSDTEHQQLMEEIINPNAPTIKTLNLINSLQTMSQMVDFTSQWVDYTCTFCGQRGHQPTNCRRRSIVSDSLLALQSYMYYDKIKLTEALDLARKYGVLQGASDQQMNDLIDRVLQMRIEKDTKRAQYLAKSKASNPQYGPGGSKF